jgi:hypothetical protein
MTPAQFTRAKLRPPCKHIEDEYGLCFECNLDMVTARGGKREGAGRPKVLNPPTKQIKVLVTEEQHQKFLDIGGSRWLKKVLNDLSQPPSSASER